MITYTSLLNPSLACKIHGAMIKAAKNSRLHPNGIGYATVGDKFIVWHSRHNKNTKAHRTGFLFFHYKNGNGQDITPVMLKALRCQHK